MTDKDQELLIELLTQEKLERVTPKMEAFRKPCRIKLAKGGRGAGAKSMSTVSLIVQRAQYEKINVCFLREQQNSLAESSHKLVCETITRLRYSNWRITNQYIDSPKGSHFIFRGIIDLRASMQLKSIEGYDIFFIEEASFVSEDSLNILIPTLRKDGSELWAIWNPLTEVDPIYTKLWCSPRADMLKVDLKEGREDNPFFPAVLQRELEADYERDKELAAHIWGGFPQRIEGNYAVSSVAIKEAMKRKVDAIGQVFIGIDVARFGHDSTVLISRKGLQQTGKKVLKGQDTQEIADEALGMAKENNVNAYAHVIYNVDDTGIGGGVTDALKRRGCKQIHRIENCAIAHDRNQYVNCITEQIMTLPINEAGLLQDDAIIEELGLRRYKYNTKGQKVIEGKEEFKQRLGRSPDSADALCLCYYEPRKRKSSGKPAVKVRIGA